MKSFDFLVVGGGPAGSVSSYLLARQGFRVGVILGPEKPAAPRIGESLPPAAARFLLRVGLGDVLNPVDHLESPGNVAAWGTGSLNEVDFVHDPYGPGWHLDRDLFDRTLLARSMAAGAETISGHCSGSIEVATGYELEVDGKSIFANYVIDASGRSAVFARLTGGQRFKHDQLHAIYLWQDECATASGDRRSWIESTPDGWWYTAPTPRGKRVVVFHTSAETARNLVSQPQDLANRLAQTSHIFLRVGELKARPKIHIREVGSSRLRRLGGARWSAVGDAAIAFDPLSSQGILNALLTAHALVESLKQPSARDQFYTQSLERVWALYLKRRNYFYQSEQRWPHTAFWQRQTGHQAKVD